MPEYFEAALKYLDVTPDQVLKQRVEGDEYIVILDLGIKGCPKHRIPLIDLAEFMPEPTQKKEPASGVSVTRPASDYAQAAGIDVREVAEANGWKKVTLGDVRRFEKGGE